MDVLGIAAWDGPSAACLVRDGRLLAAAREEFFTGRAGDGEVPRQAVEFCLRTARIGPASLDSVAWSGRSPRDSGTSRAPSWFRRFRRPEPGPAERIARELDAEAPVVAIEPEVARSQAAFAASPFDEAAVVLLEPGATAIGRGADGSAEILETGPAVAEVADAIRRAMAAAGSEAVVIGGSRAGGDAVLRAAQATGAPTWIHPDAGAGDAAAGAAIRRSLDAGCPAGRTGRSVGPGYNAHQIRTFLRSRQASSEELPRDDVSARVAGLLAEGRTLAWFAGRPALGGELVAARSILSLPAGDASGGWRAVLAEQADALFETEGDIRSPLVLARPRRGDSAAAGMTLLVDAENHRALHGVLRAMASAGREPILAVRPLARQGDAAACTPRDAWDAFLASDADACVMERYLAPRP